MGRLRLQRSEALAIARPTADYSLIIDADDVFVVPPGFAMPALDADSYTIDIEYGSSAFRRTQMVRNTLRWYFRGVLHEFLECPEAKTSGHLPFRMRIYHEGQRSTQSDTYARDAAILVQALETETDPFLVARYTFYLAQSYRDSGRHQESLDAYLKRAEMGYWQEEVYFSLLEAGRRMEALGRPPDDVIAMYARASAAAPTRAEAAHAASRLCRGLGRSAQGAELAEPALGLTAPEGGLFVEPWIYEYGLRDEFAVNAYWAGRFHESADAALRALETGGVPAAQQARFFSNIRYAFDKLAPPLPLGPPSSRRASVVPDERSKAEIGSKMSAVFERIYDENLWSQGSGPGSSLANTVEYRAFVERFIETNGIRTVTDLGCGDWQFSRAMNWSGVVYTGFDVVGKIVEVNRERYASEQVKFELFRKVEDLPGGDLLLAKEVLQHLPTHTIIELVAAIRAKYRYALLTNAVEPTPLVNTDIAVGGYRPLRLDQPPFEIPSARIFGYHVQHEAFFFKNAVSLMIGEPALAGRLAKWQTADIPTITRIATGRSMPRVLIAILAKQKESVLPLYLECIERLEYPKTSIVIYIRTNNNTDSTRNILRDWVDNVSAEYAHVEIDDSDVGELVQDFAVHEWNATRFSVLATIRNTSLAKVSEHACDFYFTADIDNFVTPATLRELVALELPIVAPYLRHVDQNKLYSNYHADIDANGYFRSTPRYGLIWSREIAGLIEVPVVHCTYLIRADVVPQLGYDDDSGRHEYVVFSHRARECGIPQYFDNRRIYGLLTLDDDNPDLIEQQKTTIRRIVLGEAALST